MEWNNRTREDSHFVGPYFIRRGQDRTSLMSSMELAIYDRSVPVPISQRRRSSTPAFRPGHSVYSTVWLQLWNGIRGWNGQIDKPTHIIAFTVCWRWINANGRDFLLLLVPFSVPGYCQRIGSCSLWGCWDVHLLLVHLFFLSLLLLMINCRAGRQRNHLVAPNKSSIRIEPNWAEIPEPIDLTSL